MGERVGYARVSSVGQSLKVQLQKLEAYGCDKVFKDKHSGTTADRPQLKQCLEYIRTGDQLVISRLDRLFRSTYHLTRVAEELKQKGVELVVLDQQIDTSTSTGKLLFNLLASIAEFENEIRKERQLDGIEAAKAKGVQFGRKAKLTDEQLLQMKEDREGGMLVKDVATKYGLNKSSVYRLLATLNESD
ncbi:recombinase family protein [Thalassotalea montiporae]